MGSSFALIGQHSPYPYIIICRFRYNFRLIKTLLNDNKRKTIACFIYSFFLGNTLIVRYFLQRVEKARSEGFTQSQNVNRIKQERDHKRSTKRFIFIHQTITLKQHNQRNLPLSFLQPFCLFFFF